MTEIISSNFGGQNQFNHCWMYKNDCVQKKSVFMNYIEFFLNMAKISQILENFAKIANKFLGQNFLDIILGHFMETAWIVGPLRQANMIFS